MINKNYKLIWVILGLFFLAQGLLKLHLIPVSLTAIILGVPYSANPIDFFIYPFIYFILKFFLSAFGFKDINQLLELIFEKFIKGHRNYQIPEAQRYGRYGAKTTIFSGWVKDFLIFSFTLWCALVIGGYLTSIGYVANNQQFLYPMILNLFLGFSIMAKYFIK
ncbi:MAG: hypothetical protein WCX71_05220 [Candidatus Buchananbacteria bacterium]